MSNWIKAFGWLLILIGLVWLLSGCGYSDHEPGSYEQEAQLLDEHLFQYMDRAATKVLSPTGYLVYVDRSTCSVAGYVRNPYGGWTRAWAEAAPLGAEVCSGEYVLEYRLDNFEKSGLHYENSYWFQGHEVAFLREGVKDNNTLIYRKGIYISEENAEWIFTNCPVGTPIIVFDSEYHPSCM